MKSNKLDSTSNKTSDNSESLVRVTLNVEKVTEERKQLLRDEQIRILSDLSKYGEESIKCKWKGFTNQYNCSEILVDQICRQYSFPTLIKRDQKKKSKPYWPEQNCRRSQ
jgi:hypothetical protein